MKKIAIFASGSGSNAENIADYFKDKEEIEISLILSNKKEAYVLERAKKLSIPTLVFNKVDFYESDKVVKELQNNEIDLVVLAGFLWLIPENLIAAFPDQIINIHPALLPNYGGKGMYGMHVHHAVKAAGEEESGITIHYVNENYDEGAIISQHKVALSPSDSADDIASKIHALEYEFFPIAIDKVLSS